MSPTKANSPRHRTSTTPLFAFVVLGIFAVMLLSLLTMAGLAAFATSSEEVRRVVAVTSRVFEHGIGVLLALLGGRSLSRHER
jgi:threonine/homoserine/homoserine lactone efflux protein